MKDVPPRLCHRDIQIFQPPFSRVDEQPALELVCGGGPTAGIQG